MKQEILIKDAVMAAIDFESAGEVRGEASLPIQVGIAEMNSLAIDPLCFYRSYLQTDRPVTWNAQKIHGISHHDLRDAPPLRSLWPQFQERLTGRYVVAHGRGTERRFLRAFPMHGFGPWIDTLTLSRKIVPGLPSYQLSHLLLHFGLLERASSLLPGFQWHEALSDALASLILLLHLIEQTELAHRPISVLTTTS